MANNPSSSEYADTKLVAESVLGKESGTPHHKAAAARIREEVQKEPVEVVLENLKAEGMAPFHDAEIESTLERVMDADKNAEGVVIRGADGKKQRTGDHETRYDEAKGNLFLANSLLKDYLSVSDFDINEMHKNIQDVMQRVYPDAAAVLATATTNAEKREILNNMFSNPAFKRALHKRLEGVLKEEHKKTPAELADKVANAKRDYTQKDIDYRSRKREYENAKGHADEFITDSSIPGSGAKQAELDGLYGIKNDLEKRREEYLQEVSRLQSIEATRTSTLQDLQERAKAGTSRDGRIVFTPTATNVEVDAARKLLESTQTSLATAKRNLEEQERQLRKITALEEEKKQALQEVSDKEKAMAMAEAERTAAQTRKTNAEVELDEAKLGVHEDKFVSDTETVIEDSVRDYLAEVVRESNDKRKNLMEEVAKEEKGKKTEALDMQMKERWHNKGQMRKSLIEKDLQALLRSEDDLRSRLGIAHNEEGDKIWEEKRMEAIESLLSYRLNMGALPANEAYILFNRYNGELFENADKKKNAYIEWKKQAKGKWISLSTREGMVNFAKAHPKAIPMLLALLTGAGLVAFAPGWTAAQAALAKGEVGKGIHAYTKWRRSH